MKRKLSLLICAFALVLGIFAIGVSAETYYTDSDGLYTVPLAFEPTTEYLLVALKGEFDQTNYIEAYNDADDSDIIYVEQKLSDELGNVTFGPFVTNGYYNATLIVGGNGFVEPYLAGYLSAEGCSNAASIEIWGVNEEYTAAGVDGEAVVIELRTDVYDSFGYPSVTNETVEYKLENNSADVTLDENVLTIEKIAEEQIFTVTATAGDASKTIYVQVKRAEAKASYIELYEDASFETAVESISVVGPETDYPQISVYAKTFDMYCTELDDTYTYTYGGVTVESTFTPSTGTAVLTVTGASGIEKSIEIIATARADYKNSALELYNLINSCKELLAEEAVVSNESGKDVYPGTVWTTQASIDTFAAAIATAEAALEKYGAAGYLDSDYADEVTTLEKAQTTYAGSFKDGKRVDVTGLVVDDFTIVVNKLYERVNELKVGEDVQLEYTTTPRLSATTDYITWTSSDTSVATVDEDGYVESVAKGKAVITARTRSGLEVSKEITVIKAASITVELTPGEATATYGSEPVVLIASYGPSDHNDIILWSVDNPEVLDIQVSEDNTLCTIIPKSAGEAKITLKSVYGNKAKTGVVTVTMPDWETAQTPVASFDSGSIIKGTEVSLETATEGATIYYTLDGTTPSKDNGRTYKAPIAVNQSLTLKAVAIGDSVYDSEVAEYSYNIVSSSVKIGNAIVRPGATATVSVSVDNLRDAVEAEITLNYPADVFTLSAFDFEDFCEVEAGDDGILTVKMSDAEGIDYDGVIGTLSFKVADGAAEADYELDITNADVVLADTTVYSAAAYDGVVLVNDYILGDADNNGKIGISDVLIIKQYLAEDDYAMNNIMLEAADVDGDGDVDNDDAILLSKYCVGWNVVFGA